MGCTQSKIENEEAVTRCKDRKLFIKEAVAYRNAFAAAHSAYAMSLKNTGAALSDYAHTEVPHLSAASIQSVASASAASVPSLPPPPPTNLDTLPPPPPPLPTFTASPLQRAASMPEMKIQKPEMKQVGPTIIEEEEAEFETQENEKLVRKRSSRGSGSSGAAQESQQQQQQLHQQRKREEEIMRTSPQATHIDNDTWGDYIFPSMDSIPGPTLAEPMEEEKVVRMTKVEEDRKVFEEKARMEEEPPTVLEEEKTEKAVEVSVPVPVSAPIPVKGMEKKMVKKAASEGTRRVGKAMNLMQIFVELDDHFLKASESAHEVSKMLEATRLHYHSNFADNRGNIDHSARVMRVITWNRSFKIPNTDDLKDDFDSEQNETHATVLDKILAWEKKLYDEVKVGELMKIEYQKKVASLNKLKKRGSNSDSLEKLKAAVSHLHTRYIVDMQSMDSTVSEINRLRDEQLYPKLVQLVDGMAKMWEAMQIHHEAQSKIVNKLRSLDISQSPKETNEHHHDRTYQLWVVVQDWHTQFCKLIDHQKDHIKALNNWLKLNLIPIESSLKEKVSSPPRVENPPIQSLLIAWRDLLNSCQDEVARNTIGSFGAVIETILHQQEEEMRLKDKCENTRKELARKTRSFEDWYRKYGQQRTPDELNPEQREGNTSKDPVSEKQLIVDSVKKRLEEEEETYQRHCLQVREKSLASLRTRLPESFSAMSNIAQDFSEMYRHLRSITQHRNPS